MGLGDALNLLGKKALICLREPALGPVFGMKGGAAGGGYAQVVPMEDINLHFTGDFSAIALANNLLAALIDNHIHQGNEAGFDVRRVTWRRVVDVNDRALRDITDRARRNRRTVIRGRTASTSSSPPKSWRSSASPTSLEDLKERLGKIVIGYTRDPKPILARDINAHGAMTALLRDALAPNLVQTLENNPAFIHGGPFANIAHGCNSVMATQAALKLADYVVTEAGFGADLGAEKFVDIKCRKAGLTPSCAVIVATIRALKYHGGVDVAESARRTSPRSRRASSTSSGTSTTCATSTASECRRDQSPRRGHRRRDRAAAGRGSSHLGVKIIVAKHFAEGGKGAVERGEGSRAPVRAAEQLPLRLRGRRSRCGTR